MGKLPDHLTPEGWMAQVFGSGAAAKGDVVKRQSRDIECIVGPDLFLSEVERRGFQAVENGRYIVVFCNAQPIRRVRARAFERT